MGLLNWWKNRKKKLANRRPGIGVMPDFGEESVSTLAEAAVGILEDSDPNPSPSVGKIGSWPMTREASNPPLFYDDEERKKPVMPEPTPSPYDFNLPLEKPSQSYEPPSSSHHHDSGSSHHHYDSGSHHSYDSGGSYDSGSSCDSSSSSSCD
jgi:hypothetical protein